MRRLSGRLGLPGPQGAGWISFAARARGALRAAVAVLVLASACGGGAPEAGPPTSAPPPSPTFGPLPTGTVIFNPGMSRETQLAVEIARSPQERQRGLMFRETLAADAGMLFDFGGESTSGFWMKNTLVPLSIAFISPDGVIIDMQDMRPLDETIHYSPQPYRWAVEANRGWFSEHGVVVGDRVSVPRGP